MVANHIKSPFPLQIKNRRELAHCCNALQLAQLNIKPVCGSFLAFSHAGNPHRDLSLGCGI